MKLLEDTIKTKIEKGPNFLAVNPETNTVYVSNNKSNSILVIDGSNKIVDRIEIEQPRKLVINSNSQRLYAISGKAGGFWKGDVSNQISVIDISSNKIIKTIGENEDFLDIAINPKTNLLYAIRKGSVEIDIFDGSSNSFVGHIGVKHGISCLSVDSDKNKIYLGKYSGRFRKLSVDVIDGDSRNLEKTFSGPRTFKEWIYIEEIHVNSKSNTAYLLGYEYSFWPEGGTKHPFVFRLNENTNKIEKSNFKYSSEEGGAFDPSRNRIYFSNTKERKVLIFDENLEEIGSVPYAPEWKGLRKLFPKGLGIKCRLVINPKTSKIYVIGVDEDKDPCLYMVSDLKNN